MTLGFRGVFLFGMTAVAAAGCVPKDDGLIGPEGGLVEALDGAFVLEIPEGAIEGEVSIVARAGDEYPDLAVGPVLTMFPHGLVFRRPPLLTIDVSDAATADEIADLVIVGRRGGEWTRLPDLDPDPEGGLIEASVLYLTTFAVVPREEAADELEDDED